MTATSFLTRIPIPDAEAHRPLGSALPWFPVVGAAIGAVVGGIVIGGVTMGVPALVAAVVAVAVSLLVTGALHEDGLADTFDGLGSGRRGDEAIEVMRDPRIGSFGAAALAISLLLQVTTLASIPQSTLIRAAVAAHAASRGCAVLALSLSHAVGTGLATGYSSATRPAARVGGFVVGVVIAALLLGSHWWVLLGAAVTGSLLAWCVVRRVGDVTGDAIGAIQQVTLLTILVGMTVKL